MNPWFLKFENTVASFNYDVRYLDDEILGFLKELFFKLFGKQRVEHLIECPIQCLCSLSIPHLHQITEFILERNDS